MFGSDLCFVPIISVQTALKDRTDVKILGSVWDRTTSGSVSVQGSEPVRTDRMPALDENNFLKFSSYRGVRECVREKKWMKRLTGTAQKNAVESKAI